MNTNRSRPPLTIRSVIDYLMSAIIGFVGLFFLLRGKFPGLPVNKYLGEPDSTDWLFGALCIVYSIWRGVRASRKSTVS
ncbi:MAG: hypothetical protein FJX92_05755 [Bacteroidetes bacterium]|nr:hypothetical protein [Bacteroidota bacterium]